MSAQPTTGLVQRFVGDPNSTIGAMIKRGLSGLNGSAVKSFPPVSDQSDVVIQPPQSPAQSTPSSLPVETNTTQALSTLEKVIDEVEESLPVAKLDSVTEGVMSQVVPQVVSQTADSFNQPQVTTSSIGKETKESSNLDQIAVDAARGVQQIEPESRPEISPEVESYLQKVEDHKNTAPPEIVIADGVKAPPTNHQYPTKPVVVLPITKQEEKAAAKKSPKFSIRWLVEWSKKLMKIFAGDVVYRPIKESST